MVDELVGAVVYTAGPPVMYVSLEKPHELYKLYLPHSYIGDIKL